MRMIGLTGGVGSGKSTVARLFAERGALVVDADAIAREVLAPDTEGLAEVVTTFGPDVLTTDGQLDRQALATIVFADDTSLANLNAITHPRIAARTAEIMATAAPDQIIVHDVPLLVENGLAPAYEKVIVILADTDTRLERLEKRGMPRDEALRRMGAQAADADRLAVAHVVITNDGDLSDLTEQVAAVWSELSLRR